MVADDDSVALSAGSWWLYLGGDGQLWTRIRRDGQIITGRWVDQVEGRRREPHPGRGFSN